MGLFKTLLDNEAMNNPKSIYSDFAHFPMGQRVRVVSHFVDFCFLRGTETGTVIRNSGSYLSIIVQFDKPLCYSDGTIRTEWGFNPENLEPLQTELPNPKVEENII